MFIFFLKSVNRSVFIKKSNNQIEKNFKPNKFFFKNKIILLFLNFLFFRTTLNGFSFFVKNYFFLKKAKKLKTNFFKKRFLFRKFLIFGFLNRFLCTFFEAFFM